MPRSPSRDLSDRYTGNRKYFRRPEWMRRDRFLLAAVALVLAGFWAVADVAAPKRTVYSYSHGPLANPHAAWESDCAACHVGFSTSDVSLKSIFNTRERWQAMTCEKCHTGAAHNANLTATGREFNAQCSNCHHDHAGRDISLVRLPDSSCTHCHANLAANQATGKPKCAEKVTNFASDHPEFRPLTTPPERTLKFSHSLHMSPGQAHLTGGKEAMTVARLRQFAGAAGVGRYSKPGQSDTDLISLDCASCHKLDSGAGTDGYDKLKASLNALGEPTRSVQPARAGGATLLPINFESHCIACHPLRAPDGASSGFVISGFDVPHRKPLEQLPAELNAGYLRSLVTKDLPALAVPIGPGGMIDQPLATPAKSIRDEATRLSNLALPILSNGDGGCAKCHDVAASKITPLPNRTVWFQAAIFDHTSHKGATCATCHPGTYTPQGPVLVEKEPVQILGIESCKACHSPAGTKVTLPDKTVISGGGVRSNCTDCHRYHNADHGLQGRGAAALFPKKPLDLADFLRGK
ncbi:MAG: cytochrome c3 family protein [Planctomycetes bacterium]|nr:cytochrome c3 family protein [Planctomycetota bacterium]